jgi:uncharacterized protein (TIGR00730 family)
MKKSRSVNSIAKTNGTAAAKSNGTSAAKTNGTSTNHRGAVNGREAVNGIERHAHRSLRTAGLGSRPIITVFGSSQPRRGDQLYEASVEMGALLGRAGFDVMTGGYKGVMEAVSRGAHGSGAHVVGITMGRFEDRVNRYVKDEIHTANFYERFHWLVDRADGYVAMGGGIGTLAEVTFTWQELQLGMVPMRPLVLVGPIWRALFKAFTAHLIRTEGIFEPMKLVDSPAGAAEYLAGRFTIEGGEKGELLKNAKL